MNVEYLEHSSAINTTSDNNKLNSFTVIAGLGEDEGELEG
jgi:hypothetical protein